MKLWHSCFLVVIVAFIIGAQYPAPWNWVKAKAGL